MQSFLNKVKSDDPICVNIEQEDEDEDDEVKNIDMIDSSKNKKIQLDVLLFEQNDDSEKDSEDSEDSEDSDSETEWFKKKYFSWR